MVPKTCRDIAASPNLNIPIKTSSKCLNALYGRREKKHSLLLVIPPFRAV
uniref:Uncharacterized protein n=1 Tax=Arion vulgaris TaxID=1028688 RepID=A0A0B6ZUU5_9EUPU